MRIAFMGTPQFAADILEDIHESVEVACVFSRPDAVRKRGNGLVASPVKALAESLGIDVFTPKTLKDGSVVATLESYGPDAIVVAAYGMILPPEVLNIPKYGCLNVHASLLPRWRGAAPIERAILAGDEDAGVCIMRMEEGLDTGDFCVSRSIPIGDMDAEELTAELASLGALALISALAHAEAGCMHWVKQDDSAVTYAQKIAKDELFLDPAQSWEENLRKVRASSPAHPAKCIVAGRQITVLKAASHEDVLPSATDAQTDAGDVLYVSKRLYLACRDGLLEVLQLKPDGKGAMDAVSFAGGVPDIRSGAAHWESCNA